MKIVEKEEKERILNEDRYRYEMNISSSVSSKRLSLDSNTTAA